MPELSRGASELDTRLAEIDRKLRAIQVDLDPEREPAPSREPSQTQEPPAAQGDSEPAKRTEQPPSRKEPPRGRSGPLAALLQRSARRSPPPGEPRAPIQGGAPTPSGGGSPHEDEAPNRPPNLPDAGMVPPEMHAKLLSAMRDLLDAYGWTLQQLPVAEDPQRAGGTQSVALSVGPFVDTVAVRAFENELLRIPGVSEVVLRGYEGENRAMFEVQLAEPNA